MNLKSLEKHTLAELREEQPNGLKLYAETAWGWSELKVAPFLRQVDQGRFREDSNPIVIGIQELRRDGSLTIRIPRRA